MTMGAWLNEAPDTVGVFSLLYELLRSVALEGHLENTKLGDGFSKLQ